MGERAALQDAKALSKNIVSSQQSEIDQMKTTPCNAPVRDALQQT